MHERYCPQTQYGFNVKKDRCGLHPRIHLSQMRPIYRIAIFNAKS